MVAAVSQIVVVESHRIRPQITLAEYCIGMHLDRESQIKDAGSKPFGACCTRKSVCTILHIITPGKYHRSVFVENNRGFFSQPFGRTVFYQFPFAYQRIFGYIVGGLRYAYFLWLFNFFKSIVT